MFDLKERNIYYLLIGISIVAIVAAGYQYYSKMDSGGATSKFRDFPFENARVVYSVRSETEVGPLTGDLTYIVTEVSENTYTVDRQISGNLYKVFENSKTKVLSRGEPLVWSDIIKRADIVGEDFIDNKGRKIKILKYHFENHTDRGIENMSIWMPEKVKVPLLVSFDFPSGNLIMSFEKTNIDYLIM